MRLVPLGVFGPSNKFCERSRAVLLLWIFFVIYVSRLSLLCCLVCFLRPCGRLLGKEWPIVFLCLVCFWYFPIWCLVPGVVVDLSISDLWLLIYFLICVCSSSLSFAYGNNKECQLAHLRSLYRFKAN